MTDNEDQKLEYKKEKKERPVLQLPNYNEVEFDEIVKQESGVQIKKKILKEGIGRVPNKDSRIRYIHQGRVLIKRDNDNGFDEFIFDDNFSVPQEKRLDTKSMPFFHDCLYTMKKGEESIFFVPAEFAYGDNTVPYFVKNESRQAPPRTNLYYWFKTTFLERNRMNPVDFDENIENAELEREDGNKIYNSAKEIKDQEKKKQVLKKAHTCYNRSKLLLDKIAEIDINTPEKSNRVRRAKIKVFLNITKVNLELANYLDAIEKADIMLNDYYITSRSSQPQTEDPFLIESLAEFLYLRGKARRLQNEWNLGLQDVEHGIEILSKPLAIAEGDNSKVIQLLNKMQAEKSKLEQLRNESKKIYDKTMKKAMQKQFKEGIYNDAKPLSEEEKWKQMDEEDQRLGRKVWFTNDGMEYYVPVNK